MITAAGREALERLRKVRELGQLELPWGGRSPRSLTRAAIAFSLRQEPATVKEKSEDFVEEQYRRFTYGWD